jgi:hypothetical protein
MNDISEKNGKRKVEYTILPGLFINKMTLNEGKALVVCESQNNKNIYKLKFDNPSPDINKFQIDNTIEIDNISTKITCQVLNYNNHIFKIITNPIIPKEDYALYCLEIFEINQLFKDYNNVFAFMKPFEDNCKVRGYVILRNKKIEDNITKINNLKKLNIII